jgi:hypothetical protein
MANTERGKWGGIGGLQKKLAQVDLCEDQRGYRKQSLNSSGFLPPCQKDLRFASMQLAR